MFKDASDTVKYVKHFIKDYFPKHKVNERIGIEGRFFVMYCLNGPRLNFMHGKEEYDKYLKEFYHECLKGMITDIYGQPIKVR